MNLIRGPNILVLIMSLVALAACSSLPQIPTIEQLVSAVQTDSETPSQEASSPAPEKQTRSAYSLQLVQLKYVSAQGLQPVVAKLCAGHGSASVNGSHNAILVAGSEEERASLHHMISSFDVQGLSGMSLALFPIANLDAEAVTEELWDLLGTQSGPFGKYVHLIPFAKPHAVLVVSSQEHYVQEIGSWIAKLDVKDSPKERKVWVYHVKNGHASDINRPLQRVISSASGPMTEDDLPRLTHAPSPNQPFLSQDAESDIPLPPTPASIDRRMQDLTTNNSPRVVADDATNSIIVWGNQVELVLVRDALKKLDRKPVYIRMDAVLAELVFQDRSTPSKAFALLKKALAGDPRQDAKGKNDADDQALTTRKSGTEVLQQLSKQGALRVISSPVFKAKDGQTAEFRMTDTVFATPEVDGDSIALKLAEDSASGGVVYHLVEGQTLVYMAMPRRIACDKGSLSACPQGLDAHARSRATSFGKIAQTVIVLTPHIDGGENIEASAAIESDLKLSALSSFSAPNHP